MWFCAVVLTFPDRKCIQWGCLHIHRTRKSKDSAFCRVQRFLVLEAGCILAVLVWLVEPH